MKRVADRINHLLVWIAIITGPGQFVALAQDGLTVDLVPSEAHPGDIIRMVVSRTGEDYAEFQLDVPLIERLHLIATEQSPITYQDGHYTQSETWIFQADSSGDIPLDDVRVRLRSGKGETETRLPPMVISVVPYADNDGDPQPLDWEEPETEPTGRLKLIVTVLGILLAGLLHAAWDYRRKHRPKPEAAQPDLRAEALSALDRGCLNADAVHRLYASSKADMSAELKLQIEEAIYANRGDPNALATSIRKELQP